MSDFVDVAGVADIPQGRMRAYVIGEKKVVVYHTARGFFSTENTCPHRGGPLAEGDLIGGEIICPWHLWGFDVATGICTGNAEVTLATHEVRIEGDRILVKP
jgi:nitrite reductase/ring-hydroxylating ferredoxin subunit